MMVRSMVGVLGLTFLLLGCSGGAESGERGSSEQSAGLYEPAEGETVLADVDVGYGRILFVESRDESGRVTVNMMETTSASYGSTPFDQAVLAGHTTLELFSAVLPKEAVPESIVKAHAAEAKLLGRATDDVQPAKFDKNAPIEKFSAANCTARAFAPDRIDSYWYYYNHKTLRDNESGGSSATPRVLFLRDSSGNLVRTTDQVTLYVCNDGNANHPARASYKLTGAGTSGAWVHRGWANVAEDNLWKWYMREVYQPPCVPTGAPDEICEYPEQPTYYSVGAYSAPGNNFHMRAAAITYKGPK